MPRPNPIGLVVKGIDPNWIKIINNLRNPVYTYPGITFDDIPDQTVLDTYFASPMFSVAGATGKVYARKDMFANSSPNVVTLMPASSSALTCFDSRWGGIQVNFFSPVSKVSIDAKAVPTPEPLSGSKNVPFIQAFDAAGNFLGKTLSPITWGAPDYGEWKTLVFQSPTRNIAYVQFSSQHNDSIAVYGMFDNLAYGNEPATTKNLKSRPELFDKALVGKKELQSELAKMATKLSKNPVPRKKKKIGKTTHKLTSAGRPAEGYLLNRNSSKAFKNEQR